MTQATTIEQVIPGTAANKEMLAKGMDDASEPLAASAEGEVDEEIAPKPKHQGHHRHKAGHKIRKQAEVVDED